MDEAERREISARIAQARTEAGLTQQELADLLGVHKRTVENYEHGRVPWEHLREIASVTGRPWEWIVRGEVAAKSEDLVRAVIQNELTDVLATLARIEARLAAEEEPPPTDS